MMFFTATRDLATNFRWALGDGMIFVEAIEAAIVLTDKFLTSLDVPSNELPAPISRMRSVTIQTSRGLRS